MEQRRSNEVQLTIAGAGGGGILTTGKLLIEAAISKYNHVSLSPNYAAAMRGGEVECTAVLSDNEISSPVMFKPQAAIILSRAMLAVFEKRVQPGGIIIVDCTMIPDKVSRDDVQVFYIPATEVAAELGASHVANLILLGAYIEATKAIPLELAEKALERRLAGGRKQALLPLNRRALREGARLVAEYKG